MRMYVDSKSPEEDYAYAISLYANGFYENAYDKLFILIKKDFAIWQLWFAIAKCLQKLNNQTLALQAYSTAAMLQPQNATTYLKLAEIYIMKKDLKNAKNMLKTAIKYNKDEYLNDRIDILSKQNNIILQ